MSIKGKRTMEKQDRPSERSGRKALVTGSAGFIGFHLSKRLINEGYQVVGLDDLNDYYDVDLKLARLASLIHTRKFRLVVGDVSDPHTLDCHVFDDIELVAHLAAQAGVRHSVEDPVLYVDSNIRGTVNVFESCVKYGIRRVLYASSSSVYGNTPPPWGESNPSDPLNMYAVTKAANEMTAKAYANLYGIESVGVRYFTVYGPWGRPDMALFKFVKGIIDGTPITLYDGGKMWRNWTYIDDAIEFTYRLMTYPDLFSGNKSIVYNVAGRESVSVGEAVRMIEERLKRKAIIHNEPATKADVKLAEAGDDRSVIGSFPRTSFRRGLAKFIDWYLEYYVEGGKDDPERAEG
jgi:UDP-glucuronate 4-epimerase